MLTNYVDLSGALPLDGRTLVKAAEPQFDLNTTGTIRLSRPGVFRKTGEVLVKDDQEGQAHTETQSTVEEHEGQQDLERRMRALSAAMQLNRTKMSANATTKVTRTNTASANITFGQDWLIYSASICPESDEEEAWRQTFPNSYTSVAHIHRPTQFAQALGIAICEHVGVNGKPEPITGTFDGFRAVEVERVSQIVLHGPVLYVDDPYRCIEEANTGCPQICSMIFVKSRKYAAQKEYRFAALSIRPEMGEVVDLPVSGMMKDCLTPVKMPTATVAAQVTITPDDSEKPQKRKISREHTYRKQVVKRKSTNLDKGDEKTGHEEEEVVEEIVTSPDEVPKPFPKEERQPDVIIFHQVGNHCRYIHHAYRTEETERWKIKTLRENSAIVENPCLGRLPDGLTVPEAMRLDVPKEDPAHPGFILNLCLNPSEPRPPKAYSPLARFSAPEVAHTMACYRSLGMAVDLLKDQEQERAAASAWYAFRFVLELVGRFGAIVKSLCVIEECIAVVELERAPFSDAVGWATFSGTGTYTLYVNRGDVEELVLPGQFSRAEPMGENTFIETLREYGWPLREPRSG